MNITYKSNIFDETETKTLMGFLDDHSYEYDDDKLSELKSKLINTAKFSTKLAELLYTKGLLNNSDIENLLNIEVISIQTNTKP